MPDLLDRVREELRARLTELRPAVDEHDRLDAALRALDNGNVGSRAVNTSTATTKRGRLGRKSAIAKKRAPRGANREAVMRVVGERPGITTGELAAASGVQKRTLYTLLSTLTKQNLLQREELPSDQSGYRVVDVAPPTPAQLETASGG